MDVTHAVRPGARERVAFRELVNTERHKAALWFFFVIVVAHLAEHILQAFQIYVLGWPMPEARGLIGYFYPWVISSETLHYGYALVMLFGLWLLRPGFTGTVERRWWDAALGIQVFHHLEHLLLFIQATTGHNLAGRPVPTSLIQLWVPRVELHLFYNTIVFVPMVVAMYYHMFPTEHEAAGHTCTCSWHRPARAAA